MPLVHGLDVKRIVTVLRTERILKVDEVNSNRRLIPRHVVEKFLESYDGKDILCTYSACMEKSFDISEVSHVLKNLRLEGNYLCGEVEVLVGTPVGGILAECFGSVSFPASFLGTLECNDNEKYMTVQSMDKVRCFVSSNGVAFI